MSVQLQGPQQRPLTEATAPVDGAARPGASVDGETPVAAGRPSGT